MSLSFFESDPSLDYWRCTAGAGSLAALDSERRSGREKPEDRPRGLARGAELIDADTGLIDSETAPARPRGQVDIRGGRSPGAYW